MWCAITLHSIMINSLFASSNDSSHHHHHHQWWMQSLIQSVTISLSHSPVTGQSFTIQYLYIYILPIAVSQLITLLFVCFLIIIIIKWSIWFMMLFNELNVWCPIYVQYIESNFGIHYTNNHRSYFCRYPPFGNTKQCNLILLAILILQ